MLKVYYNRMMSLRVGIAAGLGILTLLLGLTVLHRTVVPAKGMPIGTWLYWYYGAALLLLALGLGAAAYWLRACIKSEPTPKAHSHILAMVAVVALGCSLILPGAYEGAWPGKLWLVLLPCLMYYLDTVFCGALHAQFVPPYGKELYTRVYGLINPQLLQRDVRIHNDLFTEALCLYGPAGEDFIYPLKEEVLAVYSPEQLPEGFELVKEQGANGLLVQARLQMPSPIEGGHPLIITKVYRDAQVLYAKELEQVNLWPDYTLAIADHWQDYRIGTEGAGKDQVKLLPPTGWQRQAAVEEPLALGGTRVTAWGNTYPAYLVASVNNQPCGLRLLAKPPVRPEAQAEPLPLLVVSGRSWVDPADSQAVLGVPTVAAVPQAKAESLLAPKAPEEKQALAYTCLAQGKLTTLKPYEGQQSHYWQAADLRELTLQYQASLKSLCDAPLSLRVAGAEGLLAEPAQSLPRSAALQAYYLDKWPMKEGEQTSVIMLEGTPDCVYLTLIPKDQPELITRQQLPLVAGPAADPNRNLLLLNGLLYYAGYQTGILIKSGGLKGDKQLPTIALFDGCSRLLTGCAVGGKYEADGPEYKIMAQMFRQGIAMATGTAAYETFMAGLNLKTVTLVQSRVALGREVALGLLGLEEHRELLDLWQKAPAVETRGSRLLLTDVSRQEELKATNREELLATEELAYYKDFSRSLEQLSEKFIKTPIRVKQPSDKFLYPGYWRLVEQAWLEDNC